MLVSVQALRAFAAWLVVFHHFMQVFFNFEADNLAGHLLSTRGQMGVDIFFVISGFVIYITTADRSIKTLRFLWRRASCRCTGSIRPLPPPSSFSPVI